MHVSMHIADAAIVGQHKILTKDCKRKMKRMQMAMKGGKLFLDLTLRSKSEDNRIEKKLKAGK